MTATGSGCHGECFWLLYCQLETLWGWDLCSCVALYKKVLNLLASRHCEKANVKQVVLWAVEVMKHRRHWILWCLVKGGCQPFSQQVFLLSPAACSPPGSRKGVCNPLEKWPTVWSWWKGPTPVRAQRTQQHPVLFLCKAGLLNASGVNRKWRMLFPLASSSPSYLRSSDNINWKTFQEEWVWFYFVFFFLIKAVYLNCLW